MPPPRLFAPGGLGLGGAALGGGGARPLAPLAPLHPGIVSVLLTPFVLFLHAVRAMFYPPWFFFFVMCLWAGFKCAPLRAQRRHRHLSSAHLVRLDRYKWQKFSVLSATDQVCIIGAFLLAFMQQFGGTT